MSETDLTFFTNEPERNLYDRFNKILNKNTRFFDVLVGYFRASGFYLLQDSLKNVEKTRILIGINTDSRVLEYIEEANGQILTRKLSGIETIENYKENLKQEFDNSEDTEEVEIGVNNFVQMIRDGKLEIRVYTKQPIHAKLYIMRDFDDSPDYGRVITGSSNFSQNGLQNNLEFNVELKNTSDVKFAQKKFEELWDESVEVSNECIDTIENKTWIKSDITPYEMYVKFLYEYFKEEINDDLFQQDLNQYTPDGFKPLQYQKDAIIQAKRMLEKHNGVFISDVVGLGKTYICAMLAQQLDGGKLILCPPVLKEYWEKVLQDFGVRKFKVESEGKLDKVLEYSNEYKYIFIDESHRFRNSGTESYTLLHQICVGKKVILISATPQNNYSTDIENQLYLFENKYNSTIVKARNLSNFFNGIRKTLKNADQESDAYQELIKNCSEEIRDKVLREVMIRRTRTEIENVYKDDLEKQHLKFPKVGDPNKLTYEFDERTEKIFEETIKKIVDLSYARYKPLTYVNENVLTSDQKTLLVGQKNMGGFMKGILVKRLESSKYAFQQTLGRFIKSIKEFIKMYNSGTIWISKKVNVEELLANGDYDRLLNEVEKENATRIYSKDLNENFLMDLNKDLNTLEYLKNMWYSIKEDDKLIYFINILKNNTILKNNKLIIFTESSETASYLKEELEKKSDEKIILFNGSMPDKIRDDIKYNFDPNCPEDLQRDEYRILITTDILAEGINLHRSNVIINYDLPWNPTKIMQRVGRINRVGTKYDEIFVFNFFPTSKSNEQMSLEQNIESKIQMFHDMLGEDSKFLTDNEVVSTHELFRRMSKISEEDDDEVDSELSYLKIIREIRDKDKKLYNKIKDYPKKIKIARKNIDDNEKLITFFRKGYLKKFYITSGESAEEITFEDAIRLVKAEKEEKNKIPNKKYYDWLKINKEKFDEDEKNTDLNDINVVKKKGSSNAKNIINCLNMCIKSDNRLTEEEKEKIEKIIKLLQNGELPDLIIKNGNKMLKQIKDDTEIITFFKKFEKTIGPQYFDFESKIEDKNIKNKKIKEIVLSEFFI